MTTTQIYLNSKYANVYNNGTKKSDLLFYFTTPIVRPIGMVMSLKIINATIPLNFGNVTSSNNTLVITKGVSTTTYTLDAGNYNALTFTTALSSLLSADGYSVTYSTTTNKLTFTNASSFTINSTSTCLLLLGFESGSDTTSGTSLTSSYGCDLSGDNVLYISFPSLTTQNLSSVSGTRSSIVRSALCNVAYGGILFLEETSTATTIHADFISFLHVQLLGEDEATLIDMNNTDWQMTIEISFSDEVIRPPVTTLFKDSYKQYIDQLHSNGTTSST
jgi:hypothetical protein